MTALIGSWSSPSARVVSAEVVDQKQGRRALLRYRVDDQVPDGARPSWPSSTATPPKPNGCTI